MQTISCQVTQGRCRVNRRDLPSLLDQRWPLTDFKPRSQKKLKTDHENIDRGSAFGPGTQSKVALFAFACWNVVS
jgi:hypothetical protein